MNRILYVDYIYQKGHVNFNKIHIDALLQSGYDVKLVLYSDMVKQLDFAKSMYALVLPSWMKQREGYVYLNKFLFCLALIYIRLCVHPSSFDKVIVSSWEEASMGLFPLCRGMYLISHGNARSFHSNYKLWAIRKLSQHNTFVVFNPYMASAFYQYNIHQVKIISHGCTEPYQEDYKKLDTVEYSKYRMVVFQPSPKSNPKFVNEILDNEDVRQYLHDHSILLILRGGQGMEHLANNENILLIRGFLPEDRYRSLFLYAHVILIAYPETFDYQVSGVSYECAANTKRSLIYRHPSLEYCREFYNYNPFFEDCHSFIERLQFLANNHETCCIINRQMLCPNYHILLECHQ